MKLHDSIRECLRQEVSRLSVIAEALGVPPSKLSAELASLQRNGYVHRISRGHYALTPKGLAKLPTCMEHMCEICECHTASRLQVFVDSDPMTTRLVCQACYALLRGRTSLSTPI